MILLLDNYDSFTWNLFDYLSQLGSHVIIKRNDEITHQEISNLNPRAIVISPGPGTPGKAGIVMDVVHRFHKTVPLLGICLGYQAIGIYFGATLTHANAPVHGKTSSMLHEADLIFKNIPSPAQVMRYHSLNISDIPQQNLKIIACTTHGEPMAIKHVSLPVYGLQFHPESILTPQGFTMLYNWHRLYVK